MNDIASSGVTNGHHGVTQNQEFIMRGVVVGRWESVAVKSESPGTGDYWRSELGQTKPSASRGLVVQRKRLKLPKARKPGQPEQNISKQQVKPSQKH